MPVSVVVGGQYGSEGKGKVAAHLARTTAAPVVVRVGGTNSGHTAVDAQGRTWALRQLPAACVHGAEVVLPAGSLIDPEVLAREVREIGIDPSRVHLSPFATVIEEKDKAQERARIVSAIGSTGSGTGAALARRVSRSGDLLLARNCAVLAAYVRDVEPVLARTLASGRRVIVEGSQGFGLSVYHGGHYPHATSRDTTAATFLGEAGLSPFDVDDVTLVLRAFPIRVAGESGPLENETDWSTLARQAGLPGDYVELTTATRKVRRVARFDPEVARRAIAANKPTRVVLNHCDYLGPEVRHGDLGQAFQAFVEEVVEGPIQRRVDWVGLGPASLVERDGSATRSQSFRSVA